MSYKLHLKNVDLEGIKPILFNKKSVALGQRSFLLIIVLFRLAERIKQRRFL